jgi:2-methylisocitrate lyase-like PEP mutase family enzyme
MHGPTPMRAVEDAVARIRAAREAARAAGVPIVINARVDVFIKQIGDEASRFDEAIKRGKAYLAAGADCIYPITLRDPATIERLVRALGAPININVRAGYPGVAELEALGVRRVTTATALTMVALSAIRDCVRDIRAHGRFDSINPSVTHPEMQQLMATK